MFSSRSTQNLAFVSRQLSQLLRDHSLEESLDKLTAVSPTEYAADIEQLSHLVQGRKDELPTLGPSPYAALKILAGKAGGARDILFIEFEQYVRQSKVIFETYWAGIIGLTWYLASVSSVALTVGLIYARFLVPPMDQLTNGFGATLPTFSQTMFNLADTGIPTFAVVLFLLVSLVVFFVTQFHRRIQSLTPLPAWPVWLPVIGRVTETYNFGLFLNYTHILRRCGVDLSEAMSFAANASRQGDRLSVDSLSREITIHEQSSGLTELAVAAKLGTLDAELTHQRDAHVGVLTLALVEARDRLSLVLKVALYIFVAALVIAMYLPLFKMGSVV